MLKNLEPEQYYKANDEIIFQFEFDYPEYWESDLDAMELKDRYPEFDFVFVNIRNYSIFPQDIFTNKKLTNDDVELSPNEYYNHYKELVDKGEGTLIPVYLYDHSGIILSTKFDKWDSINVGFIYIKKPNTNTLTLVEDFVELLNKEFIRGPAELWVYFFDKELNHIDTEAVICDEEYTEDSDILNIVVHKMDSPSITEVKKLNVQQERILYKIKEEETVISYK